MKSALVVLSIGLMILATSGVIAQNPTFQISAQFPAATATTTVTQSSVSSTLPAANFPEVALIQMMQDLVNLAPADSSVKAVLDKYHLVMHDSSGAQIYPPFMPTPITASVVPSSGSGHVATLTFAFPGLAQADSVNMLINSSLTGTTACYVIFEPKTGNIDLEGDEGTILQKMPANSGGTLSNSQCSISVVTAGSTNADVTVMFSATFTAAFTGAKNVWVTSFAGGTQQGNWQQIGTWTAQ